MAHPPELKAQMQADYCEGKFGSIKELCEHYGVPEHTVWKWRSEEKWQEKRKLVMDMKKERTLEAVASKLSLDDQRAHDVCSGIVALSGQKLMLIQEDLRENEGQPAAVRRAKIHAGELRALAETVKSCHGVQRVATGADKNEPGQTVIVVSDMRAQIRQAVEDGILPKANVPQQVIEGGNGSGGNGTGKPGGNGSKPPSG